MNNGGTTSVKSWNDHIMNDNGGNPVNAFRCLRLSISAEAGDCVRLPEYQGSALRGAFGHALKSAVCTCRDKETCNDCLLKTKCVYSYAFETPLPEDAQVLKLYPHAPHPFTINPMINGAGGEHHPGSEIRFGMTLIGKAIEFLPYFVYAFVQMGERGLGKGRGRFQVRRIDVLDGEGAETETVFENDMLRAPSTFLDYPLALALAEKRRPDSVTVRFKTPLRVKYRERLHDTPDFHILIRNLLRRISNLIYFHCGQKVDLPFKEYIRMAEEIEMTLNETRWRDVSRYSGRQKKSMKIGGVVGKAEYQGALSLFLPMLVLGTWIHIGKGTAFGLGCYTME